MRIRVCCAHVFCIVMHNVPPHVMHCSHLPVQVQRSHMRREPTQANRLSHNTNPGHPHQPFQLHESAQKETGSVGSSELVSAHRQENSPHPDTSPPSHTHWRHESSKEKFCCLCIRCISWQTAKADLEVKWDKSAVNHMQNSMLDLG